MPENSPAPVGFDPPNRLKHLTEREANEVIYYAFDALPDRNSDVLLLSGVFFAVLAVGAAVADLMLFHGRSEGIMAALAAGAGILGCLAAHKLAAARTARWQWRLNVIVDAYNERLDDADKS